jgi:hypothetical protein
MEQLATSVLSGQPIDALTVDKIAVPNKMNGASPSPAKMAGTLQPTLTHWTSKWYFNADTNASRLIA